MERLYILAGKAGTGKDSVAKIIDDYYVDKKVLIYSATTYLKKYIKQIYGWDGSEEDKPREVLQRLGSEIKDKYPNFFIDRMREDIKFLSGFCDIMVITGVRLEKELEFLKNEFNGVLIKMESTIENNLTDKQRQDITEVDVDNYRAYDYIIENNGSLEDLKRKVEVIL